MTAREYYAGGGTVLLDAVERIIQKMQNTQKYLARKAGANKVIFVIMTDGMENSSREWKREIEEDVERRKN